MMPWSGPGGMGGMMRWMPLMPLIGFGMLLLMVLVMGAVMVFVGTRVGRARQNKRVLPVQAARLDSEAEQRALRERYAHGEIDLARFERELAGILDS